MATGSYMIEIRATFDSDQRMGEFIDSQRHYCDRLSKLMESHDVAHSIELIDNDNGQLIQGWAS